VSPNQPFPNNPAFRSEPVLSESSRETIWRAVMVEGLPLKAVSAEYKVDVRRVAAVVRMKEIEKKWEREVSLFFLSNLSLVHLLFVWEWTSVMNCNTIRLVLKT
jgi:hypothetical protein